MIQQPYFSLFLIIVAIAIALYALSRWKVRHLRSTIGTGALLLWCGSFWMLTNAFEMMSLDPAIASWWNRVQYIAIVPVPPLWLYLSLQFTGRENLLSGKRLLFVSVVPIVCLVAALTNDIHHLFVSNSHMETVNGLAYVVRDPGPFMVGIYLYGYILVLIGTLLLVQRLLHSKGFFWQGTIVLIGFSLSITANILDWSGLNPFPYLKLTPLALSVSVPIFVITLVRARRADIVPIARSTIIQSMQDAILVLDAERRIIDINPAAEAMIGYSLSDILGTPIASCWSIWNEQIDLEAIDDDSYSEISLEVDGVIRVFDVSVSRVSDGRKLIMSEVIVFHDITERVRAEKALRHSEEHFRALTENSSDIVVIVDSGGVIRFASSSLVRNFGFEQSDILGHSSLDFIHPDDAHLIIEALAEAMQRPGPTPAVVARFRQASGHWRKLECVGNNMLDHPAVDGIVVNARDVTDRESVAERLRHSEEVYRLHFAHVDDVIYSFDRQLKISNVTPSIQRQLGLEPERFVDKNISDLGILAPEYLEKMRIEAQRVLAGENVEKTIYEFIAADGSRVSTEVSSSPIYKDDQVVAAVNVARNISERITTEARLRQSLAEKEIMLKEVHHRVKNNLQIIASLLSLQSDFISNPVAGAQFEDSQHRIHSMALVHERLYRSTNLAFVDFREYLDDLVGHLYASYRVQTEIVQIQLDIEHVYLDIDTAVPCGLIVNELVSNAFKHAFPKNTAGTVRVTVRRASNDELCLTVEDDGVGISDEIDIEQNASLGLLLIKSLTRQLNGKLSMDTKNGLKASITFYPLNSLNSYHTSS